jgi:anti-sigma factor RsiW
MKGCPEWMDQIAGCAVGDPVEAALAAHLAGCPDCASALRESQAMAARMDEALKRRGAAEPPMYGPERVMARVGEQRPARGFRWRWAAAGSAVVALMAMVMWMRGRTGETDATALSTWRSPTEELLRPPVAAAWTTTPRLGEGYFEIKP